MYSNLYVPSSRSVGSAMSMSRYPIESSSRRSSRWKMARNLVPPTTRLFWKASFEMTVNSAIWPATPVVSPGPTSSDAAASILPGSTSSTNPSW